MEFHPVSLMTSLGGTRTRLGHTARRRAGGHVDAAAAIGARGLIVHGGHVNKADDPAVGFDNWRKAIEACDLKLPLLIENTAGGDYAMARHLDALDRLWSAIGEYGVGFCLDTCHAHAGGNELETVVEKVRAITGRIDLVHANDSRDAFDSGADRHATFGQGRIDPSVIADIVRAAGCDAVVETPAEGQAADLDYLRSAV